MTANPADSAAPGNGAPVPVIVHLSGRRRGRTSRPAGDYLRIGTFPGAEIPLAGAPGEVPPEEYAVVRRQGDLYEIDVAPGKEIFVNGDPVDRRVLASGDVLEIGQGGPVLRFRVFPAGASTRKSFAQAMADCTECARRGSGTRLGRLAILLRAAPRELISQTTWPVRAVIFGPVLVLAAAVALFAWRSVVLERRLAEERGRVAGLAELLQGGNDNPRTSAELGRMLEELQSTVSRTARRVQALEGQSAAARLVIAAATRSTAFVQGGWGFVDPRNGQPLRLMLDPEGRPLRGPDGSPVVTTDSSAPVLEALYTGTAFAVGDDGHLLTNRHVAQPWLFDQAAQRVAAQGWTPVMRRLVAYLPGVAEPFPVRLVAVSDSADLAVLRVEQEGRRFASLPFADGLPQAGDEVIVLGYPLGIRALMVRADAGLLAELRQDTTVDFWGVAERLGRAGQIAPLASRGIVSQVGRDAVVYDAETTVGGSGGPVLSFRGEVLAVNSAILPEFGGSNLGVPARRAADLLRGAGEPTGN